MKRLLSFILIINILILNTSIASSEDNSKKTIIIVLDELDFDICESIINKNLSMGLLSTKTGSTYKDNSEESLFMTIATGRRVDIPSGSFRGIEKINQKNIIKGYREIINTLDQDYNEFSKNISFLGDKLRVNNKKTSYMGSRSDVLIIADKSGEIDYVQQYINYDLNWLKDNTKDILNKSDVFLMSFDIDENASRIDILKSYLESLENRSVIIFPRNISGDMKHKLNNTLVPIMYSQNDNEVGIITSKSTKRLGVVTNLDIFSTILNYHDINIDSDIGNKIQIITSQNISNTSRNIFKEFLNLTLIKYIFHGLLTIFHIYLIYTYLYSKRYSKRFKIIMQIIPTSILISIILGLFHIHTNIIIYLIIVIGLSILISVFMNMSGNKVTQLIAILTNIFILLGTFFNTNMLYNSFIGYNSIVAGGRFYGFNNEIMGVLIITSIISYFFIKDLLKNNIASNIFLLLYIPLIIVSLSGRLGANFGGYLTSIVLFLLLIYRGVFNRKSNVKSFFILTLIGLLILSFNLYFDTKNINPSHAGKFIERIRLLGYYEFIDMIIKKLKQLAFMIIVPPWSIIIISQTYFIFSKFRHIKRSRLSKYTSMFLISVIALLFNDTGVVAFAYMNTYLISLIIENERV